MSELSVNIESILPHRNPFLFIDRMSTLEPGVSGEALKTFPLDDPIFSACQKGFACVPIGILIECLAQCSAIVAFSGPGRNSANEAEQGSPRLGVLGAIHEFDYHSLVLPGDTVSVRVKVTHCFGDMLRSRGELFVEERRCASGELSFMLLARDVSGTAVTGRT